MTYNKPSILATFADQNVLISMSYQPKVALVHDDFVQQGGAENLFAEIAQIYPNAPIYTSLVDWNKPPMGIDRNRVRPSFMQRIPFAAKFYKLLLSLYPLAFESFNLSAFDVVISSTTRFAKGVVTPPDTIHICYLNSIPRFLWHTDHKKSYLPSSLESIFRPIINWLKRWDMAAASRVDFFIANSQNVKTQIKKVYNRNSQVIYPFADTDFFKPPKIHNWRLKSQKYYLIVSRLVRWKKIEIAIRAANNLGINLFVIGEGPDRSRLKHFAGKSTKFIGKISKEELRQLYQNAQALIVTQEEDFGIVTVEAQACGLPVIAYDHGGQKEIIKNGLTGLFFPSQSTKALEDAINASSAVKWNLAEIVKNGQRFSKKQFVKNLKAKVKEYASQK
ncbi:MAG: glycosyltransferase [Candidatus Curtissbacteria bacterium]|nr:glycosyltransferase [Candidatus Curtissbacteria bacterium]